MARMMFASGGVLPDPATGYPFVQKAELRYFADPDCRLRINPDADGIYRLPEGQREYWVEVVGEATTGTADREAERYRMGEDWS